MAELGFLSKFCTDEATIRAPYSLGESIVDEMGSILYSRLRTIGRSIEWINQD
jgi:hypothetical protein